MRGLRTLLRAVCPSAFPGPSQAQSAQSAVWGQCRAYSLPCQAQQMQFSTCLSTRMTHLMAARHVAQPGLAGLHLAHFRQPQILAQAGVMPWAVRGLAKQAGKSWGDRPAVSLQTLLIAMIVGAAGISAVQAYKDEKVHKVMSQSQQVAGKASVGGPFSLIDYDGKTFTSRDLRGEFALLYFGFTHCPDICPDELEKLSEAVTNVENKTGVFVVPVFISVDPERDTPARIKTYVHEFHPKMLGLTGDLEDIKKTSKAYRVYYSKTGEAGAKDYLVDHSIIHYLIDPDGEFVTFYAKNYTADQMTDSLIEHIVNWKNTHPDYHPGKQIKLPEPKPAA